MERDETRNEYPFTGDEDRYYNRQKTTTEADIAAPRFPFPRDARYRRKKPHLLFGPTINLLCMDFLMIHALPTRL